MKTVITVLRADWAPTMEASARALAMVVAIPAAIVLVLAQWLLFTYRKPLAGVLALVPVRKPEMAYSSARLAMASQVVTSRFIDPTIEISDEAVAGVRGVECWTDRATGEACFRPVALLPPVLAPLPIPDCEECEGYGEVTDFSASGVELVEQCPKCDGTGKQNFSAPEPTVSRSVAPPTTEISPALDAALDQALGLKRPALIVTSTPQLALGSGPRVGRRGSKEATEAFDRAVLAPRPQWKGSSKVATLDHLDRAAERDRYRDHSRDDG